MPARTIDRSPKTEHDLRRSLANLGVEPGATLIVHSSMSSIGWVLGGAPTVVRAFLGALGEEGTLVMPAATPHSADPADWVDPRVPDAWLEEVREHLPLFDPQTTPTTLGAIAETFRTWPGTVRSDHPLESVCARGPLASAITREHPLAFSEGREGPFGQLHRLDARILLLGVGFNRCTALHFAESLVAQRRTTRVRFPTVEDGGRVWIEVTNMADDNDRHFPVIGEKYLSAGRARTGTVGDAPSALLPMRDLVELAVDYFESVL